MKRYWLILPPIFAVILIALGISSLFLPIAALHILLKILGIRLVFVGIFQLFFYFFIIKLDFCRVLVGFRAVSLF